MTRRVLLAWLCTAAATASPLLADGRRAAATERPGPARKVPDRIVTIAPNAAETLCLLGACDRIVGVSKYCVHPPELADRPRVGGLDDPDLEKILALQPDLLILRGRNDSLSELCRRRGIELMSDPTNDSLDDIATTMLLFGRRLDREEEAKRAADRFRARLDRLRKLTADRPRPRVLLVIARNPDTVGDMLTAGRDTFLSEMLEIAGGTNVFGDSELAWPKISAEAIVARRPDVIIELMPDLASEQRERLRAQWNVLAPVPAVKAGRIHYVTDDNGLIPSPRFVDIVEKVAYLLHPELKDAAEQPTDHQSTARQATPRGEHAEPG